MLDESSNGIMYQSQWDKILAKRTAYVDAIDYTSGTGGKFKTSQNFYVHYLWTDGPRAGDSGQYRQFASNSLKYALDIWKADVKKWLNDGHKITWTLTMGNYPNRQVIVSSRPMDHKST